MSYADRHFSIINIVAYAGDKGITLEEMFDLDERTMHTNLRQCFIETAYMFPDMFVKKDGRYYFHPEFKRVNEQFLPDWAENFQLLLRQNPPSQNK